MNYPRNVLEIPSATPETTDAAQYMYRNGRKQWNLCGEFCVAYVTQDEAHTSNIDSFLDYWQANALKWYQSAFYGGLGRTTGIYDLEKMLEAYGYITPCKRFNLIPSSPLMIKDVLVGYQAIIGVHIDYTGYLVGSGIPHWVVLENLTLVDNNHSIVDIYNPYTNNIEPYSWREFMNSTGAYKNGIWVPR